MYPTQLLAVMLLLTAAALAVQLRARARRTGRLRDLAAGAHMHFSPRDRFGLAARVARDFPIPGVADVRVVDLLYRSDERGHRYLFIADHTRGVLGIKRRIRSVVLLSEPRATPDGRPADPVLRIADPVGSIIAQYESLLRED